MPRFMMPNSEEYVQECDYDSDKDCISRAGSMLRRELMEAVDFYVKRDPLALVNNLWVLTQVWMNDLFILLKFKTSFPIITSLLIDSPMISCLKLLTESIKFYTIVNIFSHIITNIEQISHQCPLRWWTQTPPKTAFSKKTSPSPSYSPRNRTKTSMTVGMTTHSRKLQRQIPKATLQRINVAKEVPLHWRLECPMKTKTDNCSLLKGSTNQISS